MKRGFVLNNEEKIPLVSVILPTFNGEKYIDESILSILKQTLVDFELIVVDDGSTDETPAILRGYELSDSRVKILRQENMGVSEARNSGLGIARGEYVLFVDDDDWFDESMLELMCERAQKDRADICVCDGYLYDMRFDEVIPGKSYLVKKYLPAQTPFSSADLGPYIFNFSTMHVWNKLFRKEFLLESDLKFEKREYSEDAIFVMLALVSASAITFVDKRLFKYRVHEGTSVSDKGSKDILGGYRSLLEVKEKMVCRGYFNEDVERSFVNKAFPHLLHFRRMADSWESFLRWYEGLVKEGGLVRLGLFDRRKDYFHNPGDYELLQELICSDGPQDYLFSIYLRECDKHDKSVSNCRKEKKKANEANNQLRALRGSKTFKIGKVLLWIPSKLRGALSS